MFPVDSVSRTVSQKCVTHYFETHRNFSIWKHIKYVIFWPWPRRCEWESDKFGFEYIPSETCGYFAVATATAVAIALLMPSPLWIKHEWYEIFTMWTVSRIEIYSMCQSVKHIQFAPTAKLSGQAAKPSHTKPSDEFACNQNILGIFSFLNLKCKNIYVLVAYNTK